MQMERQESLWLLCRSDGNLPPSAAIDPYHYCTPESFISVKGALESK